MNRYPLWKYLLIGFAVLLGLLFTLPNFFGEDYAVQISSARSGVKADTALLGRVEESLKKAAIPTKSIAMEGNSIKARFADADTQIKAKDAIIKSVNPNLDNASYTVALNLVTRSPRWLSSLGALPMYLGLDLRGGVHFLMQVDMKAALDKRSESDAGDIRRALRKKEIRYSSVTREGRKVAIKFRDAPGRELGRAEIAKNFPDLVLAEEGSGDDIRLIATLRPEATKAIEEAALQQNILTLRNRVNELGVAEPVIQQQGADRVVVQLPGVQDTAKAKEILGRTATLEIRLVDEEHSVVDAVNGNVPFGSELFMERTGEPILIRKQVELTGDSITDASPGFDSQSGRSAVHVNLNSAGANIFKEVTRANVKKRMAILLIEKGKTEVVTAPTIQEEIGGGRVQITGMRDTEEAKDISLLLRSGSLAAPMEIIEERTVGPSLGKENIAKGFNSTLYGFIAISAFMIVYYLVFGAVSVVALAINVLLLVGILSMLQATLTLPGMAGIALTVGMAIDANVLINERIREEIRNGNSPQASIAAGYERAWGTILDSNVTTLIAGTALLMFGSGPVRGFAVVLCLGIVTSMFSAVMVSRGIVNLIYGSRKKIDKLPIGNTNWREAGAQPATPA
jgi:preprotein translocase subunit SecD